MPRYAVDVYLTVKQTIYLTAYDADDAANEAVSTVTEEDFDLSNAEISVSRVERVTDRDEDESGW
jgi:hypothetical protein